MSGHTWANHELSNYVATGARWQSQQSAVKKVSSDDDVDNVPLAYRNIYEEVFINNDSDEEFTGFDDEDLQNDDNEDDNRFS